ncbi:proton-conducting transporter membrane subunit [Ancylomarina sp. 16SWW S1-10-2]|uniref:proton-conducting transporter transmembrane domain-containing protein n=1 Tax=Ancylomarina sp. 16SWW S1-10-2 TaxID=2499681 RepID=UPI00189D16F2|nr:proton-conducting transporter membrane subunit [Ancylomarina sp. 16SWW S1-10-2]
MMIFIFIIFALFLSISIFISRNKLVNYFSVSLFSIALFALTIYSYIHINQFDSIYYKFDALGVLLTAVLSLLSLFSFYHSYLYLKRKSNNLKQKAQYYSTLILFITAMISAYFAENLALLWVCIEATSLFVSILIFHSRTKDALEATWKYLFISSVGLAIAFIGILFLSIVASQNGVNNLNFTNLIQAAQNMDILWVKIAFVLILTGLSVKISIFPLYAVAIDAKTIAATPVNALMSTALVNVGFVGIYRMYLIVAQTTTLIWAQHVLMLVGVLSILIATIQLTRVRRFKRLLAFSSMEHMGIVTIGLAIGGVGVYAAILHLIFHSFVKAGMFFQLGAIRNHFKSIWIKDTGNYFKINPLGAIALLLGVISILAIPPSGLFVSELLVFKALFFKNYLIAILVLILLSIIIYIIIKRFAHLLYADVADDLLNKEAQINPYENISQFILFGLVIYLGVNPPLFFTDLIHAAIAILN